MITSPLPSNWNHNVHHHSSRAQALANHLFTNHSHETFEPFQHLPITKLKPLPSRAQPSVEKPQPRHLRDTIETTNPRFRLLSPASRPISAGNAGPKPHPRQVAHQLAQSNQPTAPHTAVRNHTQPQLSSLQPSISPTRNSTTSHYRRPNRLHSRSSTSLFTHDSKPGKKTRPQSRSTL